MTVKTVFIALMVSALSLTSTHAKKTSQNTYFWVIENGTETQPFSIVRIYRVDNQLVYEKQLSNVELDKKSRNPTETQQNPACLYLMGPAGK